MSDPRWLVQVVLVFASVVVAPSAAVSVEPPIFDYDGESDEPVKIGEAAMAERKNAMLKVQPPAWFNGPDWKTAVELDRAVMGWLVLRRDNVERSQFDVSSRSSAQSHASRVDKAKLFSNQVNKSERWEEVTSPMVSFEYGLNAFHYLAALGHIEAMRELGEKCTTMGKFDKDHFGNTSMEYAALYGRTEIIRMLQGDRPPVMAFKECSRALCLAAAMGHSDAVRQLLRDIPLPLNKDESGNSALDYAMEGGDQATVEALLAKAVRQPGMQPGVQPLELFRKPVLRAIHGGHVGALRAISRYVRLTDELTESSAVPGGTNLLHYAAANSTPEIADFLIKSLGFDAASFDPRGVPPLFYAETGAMAEYLLRAEPSLLDHTDASDRTAAHFLAMRTSGESLKLVLQKRPELMAARDSRGRTPIEFAVEANSAKSLTVLLDAGINPKLAVKDRSKEVHGQADGIAQIIHDVIIKGKVSHMNSTLLHVAADAGAKECAKILIDRGFDWNAVDDCGRTPLIIALIENKRDFAKWILSVGGNDPKKRMDVNAVTKHGCRAIHYAADSGDAEIVQKLVDQGADVNAAVGSETVGALVTGCGLGFDSGVTAFDLAKAGPHWKALTELRKAGAKGTEKAGEE